MICDFRLVLVAGAIVNAALYLGAVVTVGLVERNPLAVRLAVATLGVSYLAYLVQLTWSHRRWVGNGAVWASIILGFLAGGALL